MQAPTPAKAMIVSVGAQEAALTHALGQLKARHNGLVVRHMNRDGRAPPDLALPVAFRLAWICVNGQDIGLPAVRECYRQLSVVAPVIIASFGSGPGSDLARLAGEAFFGGAILQPYTSETLPLVLGVISSFLDGPWRKPGPGIGFAEASNML